MRQIGADGFTGKVEFVIFVKNRGFCYMVEKIADFKNCFTFFKTLKEMTGWTVINCGGVEWSEWHKDYCLQIEFGRDLDDKEADNDFACIWWSNDKKCYLRCCKIGEEYVCDDEELAEGEEIDDLVRWCKKCELMIRKTMIQKASEEFEA
jgi:hypothetical protein